MRENTSRRRRRRRSGLLGWFVAALCVISLVLVGASAWADVAQNVQSPIVPGDDMAAGADAVGADQTKPNAADDWRLRLISASSPLPEDFTVETGEVGRGYQMDTRVVDDLIEMMTDCEEEGLFPLICSAYRMREKQETLFQGQLGKQQAKGLSGDAAVAAAAMVVAYPGTSEHQSGLAVDICALDYQLLDEGQEETAEYQWMRKHCAEYGFILRYPPDKTDITGVIYEPWHFRYVGKEAAAEIMSQGITLEEYLTLLYCWA